MKNNHKNPTRFSVFIRQNGLVLLMTFLFLFSLAGHAITGHAVFNEDQLEHGQQAIGFLDYFCTGAFIESVFENWESEFFQMGIFVISSVWLYQKGSSESKSLSTKEEVDGDPKRHKNSRGAPWPVKRGGIFLTLYSYSLTIALFALFLISLCLHAIGGAKEYNENHREHGEPTRVTAISYIRTNKFWFESFQNWQSEFLSVGVLFLLSIYCRQQGSPQSKPVWAPYSETGE